MIAGFLNTVSLNVKELTARDLTCSQPHDLTRLAQVLDLNIELSSETGQCEHRCVAMGQKTNERTHYQYIGA